MNRTPNSGCLPLINASRPLTASEAIALVKERSDTLQLCLATLCDTPVNSIRRARAELMFSIAEIQLRDARSLLKVALEFDESSEWIGLGEAAE